MGDDKRIRGEPLRERVIDAAERLLRRGKAEFSMRDLAAEAGVSFATPFNQFGSKAAIMHALSARRIDAMLERLLSNPPEGDLRTRVLVAVEIAVAVMLEEPPVNCAVMGWLGTASPTSGHVLAHSMRLWATAIGDDEAAPDGDRNDALRRLPELLAYAFRGVLSFWTAGELTDGALADRAKEVAGALVAGFADRSAAMKAAGGERSGC